MSQKRRDLGLSSLIDFMLLIPSYMQSIKLYENGFHSKPSIYLLKLNISLYNSRVGNIR
jgi:hypothetical protein